MSLRFGFRLFARQSPFEPGPGILGHGPEKLKHAFGTSAASRPRAKPNSFSGPSPRTPPRRFKRQPVAPLRKFCGQSLLLGGSVFVFERRGAAARHFAKPQKNVRAGWHSPKRVRRGASGRNARAVPKPWMRFSGLPSRPGSALCSCHNYDFRFCKRSRSMTHLETRL